MEGKQVQGFIHLKELNKRREKRWKNRLIAALQEVKRKSSNRVGQLSSGGVLILRPLSSPSHSEMEKQDQRETSK